MVRGLQKSVFLALQQAEGGESNPIKTENYNFTTCGVVTAYSLETRLFGGGVGQFVCATRYGQPPLEHAESSWV